MISGLTYLIAHPELLNRDTLYELRTMLARYPYCQSLRLLFLKNLYLLQDSSFGDELKKSVLYVGDRKKLFYLIEGDKYVPLPYKSHPLAGKAAEVAEPGVDRTLSLIDAFLSSMPSEEEVPQIDSLHYISDYTAYLEQQTFEVEVEEDSTPVQTQLKGQSLIDNFILKAETDSIALKPLEQLPLEDEPEEENSNSSSLDDDTDESYFTETLAKIYIKQHRYTKALEIIKKLSLKYPKKNVYFADQIRFLEKLIINAKSK